MILLQRAFIAVAVTVLTGIAAGSASAQGFGEAFTGLSTDSDQPIQIEADRLEVRDAEKIAIYKGNVRVLQGATVLKTAEMRVFYTGQAVGGGQGGAGGAAGAAPGSSIDRIEASGGVVVQSDTQTATGERAVFEMATDMITLTGNVVLTENDNVVRGERLVVNLKTKEARVEGGRVQTILAPSQAPGRPR
ncbi:LptA/OstA family protein [Faunimonas sp. B44]|uniref:LptA/OstA family protein n=1 Tax=Faunimonas sp. B44 TaxID=3461493 RepID=UPI004043B71E